MESGGKGVCVCLKLKIITQIRTPRRMDSYQRSYLICFMVIIINTNYSCWNTCAAGVSDIKWKAGKNNESYTNKEEIVMHKREEQCQILCKEHVLEALLTKIFRKEEENFQCLTNICTHCILLQIDYYNSNALWTNSNS